jgi:hypothetical protein
MFQVRTSPAVDGQAPTTPRVPARMAVVALGAAVAVALTLPAAGTAAVKPTPAETLEARTTCKERGVSKKKRLAFRRCVRNRARRLASIRAAELPAIRAECRAEQMEDPVGFVEEFPARDPVALCVRMESAPSKARETLMQLCRVVVPELTKLLLPGNSSGDRIGKALCV